MKWRGKESIGQKRRSQLITSHFTKSHTAKRLIELFSCWLTIINTDVPPAPQVIVKKWNLKVFNITRTKRTRVSKIRRDIIIKSILRTFQKYFKTIIKLKEYKKRSEVFNINLVLEKISIECIKLGILRNTEASSIEFDNFDVYTLLELICWIITPKQFWRKGNLFQETTNKSIDILSQLSKRYSHSKLLKFFKNNEIKHLFKYFFVNQSEELIQKIDHSKRKDYIIWLNDFQKNFDNLL